MKSFWTMIGGFTGVIFFFVMVSVSGIMALAGIGMMEGRAGMHTLQTRIFMDDNGQYRRECSYATLQGMSLVVLDETGATAEDLEFSPCPFWLDEPPESLLASQDV